MGQKGGEIEKRERAPVSSYFWLGGLIPTGAQVEWKNSSKSTQNTPNNTRCTSCARGPFTPAVRRRGLKTQTRRAERRWDGGEGRQEEKRLDAVLVPLSSLRACAAPPQGGEKPTTLGEAQGSCAAAGGVCVWGRKVQRGGRRARSLAKQGKLQAFCLWALVSWPPAGGFGCGENVCAKEQRNFLEQKKSAKIGD